MLTEGSCSQLLHAVKARLSLSATELGVCRQPRYELHLMSQQHMRERGSPATQTLLSEADSLNIYICSI